MTGGALLVGRIGGGYPDSAQSARAELAADLSFEIDLTGFSTPEIDVIEGKKPKSEEMIDKSAARGPGVFTVTRPDDIWQLGAHRLICGAPRDQLRRPRAAYYALGSRWRVLRCHGHSHPATVAKLARAVPEARIVINHLGVPVYYAAESEDIAMRTLKHLGVPLEGLHAGDRQAVMALWREGLRELAECPNVYLKLGGIGMDSLFTEGARTFWNT